MLEQEIPSFPKKHKKGFAQFSFIPQLYLNIMINKLKYPTPVQKLAIPLILEGKDLIACYKTGSGKTLAYILPMINKLQTHSQITGARALILIPTRDLADQIAKVLRTFIRDTTLRYTLLLGGHTYEGQFESLSANPDIIVASPGRLLQLLNETDLTLSRVQIIVFDEADQLFGQNRFENEMRQILRVCPSSQRLMFSATITEDINQFAITGLRQYSYIHQQIMLPESMKLDFFILRSQQKSAFLLHLLNRMHKQRLIIFASTRYHVDYLVTVISEFYLCVGIYGKMSMEQRTSALDSFRKGSVSILVVTDVAARGLDIPNVNYVIHYDYPSNQQIFVHRSGRTARNQQQGYTLALVTYNQVAYMIELASFVSRKLTNSTGQKDSIIFGRVPSLALANYVEQLHQLSRRNEDIAAHEKLKERAFQKFKKCRAEASKSSMRKAKALQIPVHPDFQGEVQQEQAQFINRIHDYVPKKSFLELQRINLDKEIENDRFLEAVDKIRHQKNSQLALSTKKEQLRLHNQNRWKEILQKKQIKEYEEYCRQMNQTRMSMGNVEVEIESGKIKKSMQRDFRSKTQYISMQKDPNKRTEFDELPKIRMNQIEGMLEDENPNKKRKKRVWDKVKKNYVWQKDEEDKYSKQQKGKKAYAQWKKKSKLCIPKSGQLEDQRQTKMAQANWSQRRKFRHGWKESKDNKKPNLKNFKTRAFEKKLKRKMISKTQRRTGIKAKRK